MTVPAPPPASTPRRATVSALGLAALGLALLALITPLTGAEFPAVRVGWLLGLAAAIEALHGLRRASVAARRQALGGAFISLAIAAFLINAPFVATEALRILVCAWFALDAVRYGVAVVKAPPDGRTRPALAALGNTAVALLLLLARSWLLTWAVTTAGAMRIAGIAWNIATAAVFSTTEADESVVIELGLANHAEAAAIAAEVDASERARAAADLGWTVAFIVTLLAIHVGRMDADLTLLGLFAPAVAVLGDMVVAVLITWLVIFPAYLSWRGPTRWIERWLWRRHLRQVGTAQSAWETRATGAWLRWRLRLALRMRSARLSIPAALGQGLQNGLPVAAIIAATVPVWGMSWYFDTENWAAGIWNSWAESRADGWRLAMVQAVLGGDRARATPTSFAVEPEGVASGDFSFIVIGDTGEGDASQHVLRDQLLAVTSRPDVRFVVISSDVVYPAGAMKDYEAKFWLPFKGVTRPVYAIPGNHDWYDALEGFNATFLEPDAARASMRARVEADLRLTSTTEDRIQHLVREAARLRHEYGVPTGFQRAPFFELQTDRFALLAVDTGVLRQVDDAQDAWLESALDRAAGKLTMVVLGHPFFAGGHDTTAGSETFANLKRRLVERGVAIVMAGDTHDLEYYAEPQPGGRVVHHFVNGGGGAYMSFGTALAWPEVPPTTDWAHYPGRDAVSAKIEARSPWWKRPAWWWTQHANAWPFSAEWLSAAFDYNVAPFFQSFVEVRVERSLNRVRIMPYGIRGRLTWAEMAHSPGLRARGGKDEPVEWTITLNGDH